MLGILGVDARLDGVTIEADILLRQRQRFAGGDLELPGDEIEAGYRLGHRVLDLEARVHLDEPDAVRPQCFAAVGDELDRAGADIADSLGGLDGGGADLRAQVRRHARRRRFLDHLLVPALQRAIALAEMDDVAVRVGKDLKLDMARRGDVFLDQDPTGAEGGGDFAHCSFERIVEIGVLVDAAQPGRRRPPPA